jgi:hypothetical protein
MHHLLLHRCQLFCVALIDGLFRPLVSAGPTDAALGATIYFSEHVVPTNAPELCCLVGTISGRGVATNLGAVTLASTDRINPLRSIAPMSDCFALLGLTAAYFCNGRVRPSAEVRRNRKQPLKPIEADVEVAEHPGDIKSQ